jgi:hypothetical protein
MRRSIIAIAIALAPLPAFAQSFPTWDFTECCKMHDNFEDVQECASYELESRERLREEWDKLSEADRHTCLDAQTTPPRCYVSLDKCLNSRKQ